MQDTVVRALTAIAIGTILLVPARAETLDTAGKQLYAGIAVVGVGAVVGVIFLVRHENRKTRSITGCVASGPAGMTLKSKNGRVYALSGDSTAIRAGDRLTLEGKRKGKVFDAQRVKQDFGACPT